MTVHSDGQERSRVPTAGFGVTAPPQEQGSVEVSSCSSAALFRAVWLIYRRNVSKLNRQLKDVGFSDRICDH